MTIGTNSYAIWEILPPAMLAAGQADETMSVGAVGTLIVAILTGLGVWGGKKWGEQRVAATKIRPLPLPVELRDKLATKEDLHEVEEQLGSWIGRVERAMTDERRTVREEQGKLHARMDKVAESLAEIRGEMKQLNANLSRLIDRTLNGK